MYHRFHAPHDCRVEQVTYFSGDTWNVNPIALARVERLFCRNERALICARGWTRAGTRSPWCRWRRCWWRASGCTSLDVLLHLRYRGPNVIACEARLKKGEEMGWFQHGSTIIVFAPRGFSLCAAPGSVIRVGQALMRLP